MTFRVDSKSWNRKPKNDQSTNVLRELEKKIASKILTKKISTKKILAEKILAKKILAKKILTKRVFEIKSNIRQAHFKIKIEKKANRETRRTSTLNILIVILVKKQQ